MSSKKNKIPMEPEQLEKKTGLFHRKRFNRIYTSFIILLFIVGMTLILVFQIAVQNEYGFFAGLGIMGLAIILFTSRTTYKHSAPTKDSEEKEEEKKDSLQMRRR
ncbi:MAG: hypothetical protein KGD64_11675 [Candidatus Heimdallarchaeota archaeon]|nr:hypothetical protein [Candidatus Heimdallarchaeota archaeon]